MGAWFFVIVGFACVAIFIAWQIHIKNKEKERKSVRDTSYIWAVQGPFRNGEDSATAFARSIYALKGEKELESSSARILEHAKSYNQDPEGWENTRKKSIISYKGSYTHTIRSKVEKVEKLRETRDKKNLPAALVAIQLNLGCDSDLLYEWTADKEDKKKGSYKIEKTQEGSDEKLSSMDWKELPWSESPGAYEKHLKRRLESPYFSHINRAITEDDLKTMQELDKLRYLQCLKNMERFTREEIKPLLMGDGPSFREAIYIKEGLEDIMKKAMAVDGEAINIAKQALEQREICISYLRDTYKKNPEAMHAIERAEITTYENNKFSNPFIAQVLDEEGPIQNDELVSTLLTQEPSVIAIAMNIIEFDKRTIIENEAQELLHEAKIRGYIDPQYEEKIEALKGEWPKSFNSMDMGF